jgi:hypothetical protein
MSNAAIRLGARPVDERVNVERALSAFNRFIFLRRAGAPQNVTLPVAQEVVHYLQIARRYVNGYALVSAYTGPYKLLWFNFVRRATFRAFSGVDMGAAPSERKNIAQALSLFTQWKSLPRGSSERKAIARQIVSNLRVAINQDKVQIDEIISAWTNGPAPKAWRGFARRAQDRSRRQQGRGQYAGFGAVPTAQRKNVAQALQLYNQWKSLPAKSTERKAVARQIVSNLRVAINQEKISYGDIVKAWPSAHPSGQPPKSWVGFARRATQKSVTQRFNRTYAGLALDMNGIGIYENVNLPIMAGSTLDMNGADLGTAGGRLRASAEIQAKINAYEKDISTFKDLLEEEGLDSDERKKYQGKIKFREKRIKALKKALGEKADRKASRKRFFKSAAATLNPYGAFAGDNLDLDGDDLDLDGDGDDMGFLGDLSENTKKGLMVVGGLVLAGALYHKMKAPAARKNSRCNCGA